ncbi:MAG: ABC-type transport auxiliary lipoprotein family protein [Aquabacterium sp.]|uniref:PqiC family protein n=1 Tax=Aquabacterium sp. TaxID=1872578 RepID=UPI002A36927D|nr:ABC-type transport auxiliary lipoprotein family protein [Aquabacterium sp.]MDX9843641.1 ABC-type transport auxiliary lipoprotein family protein [Aquabacterium sp.]
MQAVSPVQRRAQPGRAFRACCLPLYVALGVTLAGCASTPPERSWLSLPWEVSPATPLASPPATATASASTPVAAAIAPRGTPQLRLLRVQIPEYLQSNRVRYRDSAATLAEWPGVRWAERVEIGLTRHLAAQLNGLLGAGAVCEDACNATPSAGNLQVSFVVLDHDRPQGRLHAQASWALTPTPGSTSTPRQGQVRWTEPVQEDNPAGQAGAMARVNAAIARELAQQLRL